MRNAERVALGNAGATSGSTRELACESLKRRLPHRETKLSVARKGSIVGTSTNVDARQAASPPSRPPSVPPPVMADTERLLVCASNVSLMSDQNAEIIAAPKSAV